MVFVAIVLGLLHLTAASVRIWGLVTLRRDEVVRKRADEEKGGVGKCRTGVQVSARTSAVTSSGQSSATLRPVSSSTSLTQIDGAMDTGQPRNATSISREGHSNDVGFVDWNAEQQMPTARRRTGHTDETDTSRDTTRWSEALLECLIDE